MKNGTHQNPGAGSLLANDMFSPEFGTAGPRAGTWGSEDCKCADRLENVKSIRTISDFVLSERRRRLS